MNKATTRTKIIKTPLSILPLFLWKSVSQHLDPSTQLKLRLIHPHLSSQVISDDLFHALFTSRKFPIAISHTFDPSITTQHLWFKIYSNMRQFHTLEHTLGYLQELCSQYPITETCRKVYCRIFIKSGEYELENVGHRMLCDLSHSNVNLEIIGGNISFDFNIGQERRSISTTIISTNKSHKFNLSLVSCDVISFRDVKFRHMSIHISNKIDTTHTSIANLPYITKPKKVMVSNCIFELDSSLSLNSIDIVEISHSKFLQNSDRALEFIYSNQQAMKKQGDISNDMCLVYGINNPHYIIRDNEFMSNNIAISLTSEIPKEVYIEMSFNTFSGNTFVHNAWESSAIRFRNNHVKSCYACFHIGKPSSTFLEQNHFKDIQQLAENSCNIGEIIFLCGNRFENIKSHQFSKLCKNIQSFPAQDRAHIQQEIHRLEIGGDSLRSFLKKEILKQIVG